MIIFVVSFNALFIVEAFCASKDLAGEHFSIISWFMGILMDLTVESSGKPFVTLITMVRLLSGVDFLMSFEIRDLGEI